MPTTSDNMGLTIPDLDDPSEAGLWDGYLNDSLDLIDLHDHSSGRGVRIGASGLNITTDLTLNGASLTAAKSVGFTAQASFNTARSLWVSSADGELIYRDGTGTDVQITSGGAVNVASAGGIAGDYEAAAASFYYDDANETYRALNAAPLPNDWARVACGDLDLYENNSGIANRVRLKSPASLAASYEITFAAALPGSTSLVQVSSTGALTFGNTITNGVVMSSTLQVSGAATFSSTVTLGSSVAAFTATGAITATEFKHTTALTLTIPAVTGYAPTGSTAVVNATGDSVALGTHTGADATPSWVIPIHLPVGMQITSVTCNINKTSGSGTIRGRLKQMVWSSSAYTQQGSTDSAGTGAVGIDTLTTGAITLTVQSGRYYVYQVEGGGTTGDFIGDIEVTYTRP